VQTGRKPIKYVGGFIDSKFHGKGKLTRKTYRYEGQFKEGKMDGEGV